MKPSGRNTNIDLHDYNQQPMPEGADKTARHKNVASFREIMKPNKHECQNT